MTRSRYTLMTAAYNEARFLPAAIEAVVAQTLRPDLWIIVSDASRDETDAIATEAAAAHDFIRFLRYENPAPRSPRPMAGIAWKKVSALTAGIAAFGPLTGDYLGNIDADVTFAPDFFARLIAKMDAAPDIGVGGGFIYNTDDGVERRPYFANPDVVGGPVQVFRRAVYEEIGGYDPFFSSGRAEIDLAMSFRGAGYRVGYEPEAVVEHHHEAVSLRHGRLFRGHQLMRLYFFFKHLRPRGAREWLRFAGRELRLTLLDLRRALRALGSALLRRRWLRLRGAAVELFNLVSARLAIPWLLWRAR